MKKILGIVIAAVMLVASFAVVTSAADISVTLNGEALKFEQAPVIVEERTLVPLRAIFEALGASVEWDDATKTVTSVKDDITVKLTIGSNILYKNNESVELDVPAQIVGEGYTMVPARAIAESFGVKVDWDDSTKTVILVKEDNVVPAPAGDVLINLTGESFTGNEGVTGSFNKGVTVVENPDKPGDKVLYLESNVTDKASYNYFWHPATYVPGERYVISFAIKAGNDVLGNPVSEATYGINVKVNGTDNGVATLNVAANQAWSTVAFLYTVPENTNPSLGMSFGIFANPVTVAGFSHALGWSYYLDNIYVARYDGDWAEDGTVDPSKVLPANGSGVPAGFDINDPKHTVLDLASFKFGGKGHGVPADGFIQFESTSKDPFTYVRDLAYNISDYCAVAVKYKYNVIGANAGSMQVFFATESDNAWDETKSLVQQYYTALPMEDGSQVSYFDFTTKAKAKPFWDGVLTSVRVDPGNDTGDWTIDKIVLVAK